MSDQLQKLAGSELFPFMLVGGTGLVVGFLVGLAVGLVFGKPCG